MKFRIGRYTRDVLLNHVFDDYGKLLNEISQITDKENIAEKIRKIIGKYSPKIIQEYDVLVRKSRRTRFDYLIMLREKWHIKK
ncbi:MAG: hypothetical protein ACE5J3_06835 [Methanosarcinales archaeon]